MNINRYNINSLLKLTLIFSIIFGTVSSLLAKTPPASSRIDEDNNTDIQERDSVDNQQKPVSEEQFKKFQDDLNKKTDSSTKEIKQDFQDELNNSKSLLYKKDSLIYVDLPILATLLLLWFFTQNKQQKQIKELTKNQNKIISKFNQLSELDNKLSNLDRTSRQIIEKIQDSNQKNIDSEVRLREFLSKQQFNQPINYHNSLNSDTSHLNSIAIVDKISQFVETYNKDKNSLADKAKAMVAETQASLNQRRSGNSDTVTLENTTQKKYWIIEEDNEYYLIPHAQIKFDEFNIKTLESLFDCTNFTVESSYFQLVKPAKVSKLSSETWQLNKKGKLEFFKTF